MRFIIDKVLLEGDSGRLRAIAAPPSSDRKSSQSKVNGTAILVRRCDTTAMPMLRSSTTISWEKIGSRSIQEIADHNGSCVRDATQQHEASRSVTAARRGLSKRKKKKGRE